MSVPTLARTPRHFERDHVGPKRLVALAKRFLVQRNLFKHGRSEIGRDGAQSRVVRDLPHERQLMNRQLLISRLSERRRLANWQTDRDDEDVTTSGDGTRIGRADLALGQRHIRLGPDRGDQVLRHLRVGQAEPALVGCTFQAVATHRNPLAPCGSERAPLEVI